MVVDMPLEADASDERPQPYFYFVPISEVISYEVNRMGDSMDWIIFQSGNRLFVIDDVSYRTFAFEGRKIGAMLTENAHELGYCPARFFWNDPLYLSEPDVKRSPLSKELSALDWYLFKS